MLKIKEYVRAESLEQAYELNQKRTNVILGGMLWLKMGSRTVQKAIDLSGLGLDGIEEGEDAFSIGCMATLRQIERCPELEAWTDGALRKSVESIVGVQFRNLATVGGSVFGRFGFSDVLTALLALDTEVELYHRGIIPLETFAREKRDNDILVRVIIKKTPRRMVYLSHRNAKTDFPVLTCAVSTDEKSARAVIGARPERAVCIPLPQEAAVKLAEGSAAPEEIAGWAKNVAGQVDVRSNMRGSAAYRSHLAAVLARRAMEQLQEKGGRRA